MDSLEINLKPCSTKVLSTIIFMVIVEIGLFWLFFFGNPVPGSQNILFQKVILFFNVGVIFYVGGQIYRFFMLFSMPPKSLITATTKGIEFPRLGFVAWDEIAQMKLHGFPGLGLQDVGIFLHDYNAFVSQRPRFEKQLWGLDTLLGYPHINIAGILSTMPAKDLLIHLEALRKGKTSAG